MLYPHPCNPGKEDLNIKFHTGRDITGINVKIYTAGLRLVNVLEGGARTAGDAVFTIDRRYIAKLANGTYFYAISIKDGQGNEARSKPGYLIIIK